MTMPMRSNPNASTLIERLPKMARKKWKMKKIRLPYLTAYPELFKKFLRLNNRKKTFYHEDFVNAGYYFVRTRMYIYGNKDKREWCDKHTPNWTFMGSIFYFQNERDALMFQLRWSEETPKDLEWR